jgi:hypothetical protein
LLIDLPKLNPNWVRLTSAPTSASCNIHEKQIFLLKLIRAKVYVEREGKTLKLMKGKII